MPRVPSSSLRAPNERLLTSACAPSSIPSLGKWLTGEQAPGNDAFGGFKGLSDPMDVAFAPCTRVPCCHHRAGAGLLRSSVVPLGALILSVSAAQHRTWGEGSALSPSCRTRQRHACPHLLSAGLLWGVPHGHVGAMCLSFPSWGLALGSHMGTWVG